MAVEKFRGKYYPFSNMYPLPPEGWLEADCDLLVPTSEHAYMANRFVDPSIQIAIANVRAGGDDNRSYANGMAAKEMAHSFLADGHEQIFHDYDGRIASMERVIRQKLAVNSQILKLLLQTDGDICEGNDWGDKFWGVCPAGSDDGQNHLGRIYMRLRGEHAGCL